MTKTVRAAAMRRRQDHILLLGFLMLLALLASAHAETVTSAGDMRRPAGADLVPNPLCIDGMDFSPEDNAPDPFDADLVSFHISPRRAPAGLPAAWLVSDTGCEDSQRVDRA